MMSNDDWQARYDAQTLADAELIKNSEDRLKAAIDAAKGIAKEREGHFKSMAKIAKKSTRTK